MRWITVMLVAALLAGCGGGTSPTSTSPATPGPTDGATSPGDGATSPGDGATSPGDGATRPPVPPTAGELSSILITPAELGPEWSLWEGFATWPDGQPGIIPEDQRALLPGIPLCAHAGEEALALAPTLRWEVFTQLHRATPDPFATMVVAQQFLLADEPAAVERTFTVLRDGLTRCLTAYPVSLSFLGDGPLELGEGGHDVQLELGEVVGGAGAEGDVLGEELDDDAFGGEFSDDLVQVDDGAGETVHRTDDDGVAVAGVVDEAGQGGAAGPFGAGLLLLVQLVDVAEGGELAGEVLIGGGDPGVPDPCSDAWRHF